jgi:hypothetical protein
VTILVHFSLPHTPLVDTHLGHLTPLHNHRGLEKESERERKIKIQKVKETERERYRFKYPGTERLGDTEKEIDKKRDRERGGKRGIEEQREREIVTHSID